MKFLQPRSLAEAIEAKAEHPAAVPIAGGTDVMVEINFDARRPEALLDLNRVSELSSWQCSDGRVRLGATVTYTRLLAELGDLLPGLALAARTVGHVHRHPASLRYEHGSTADGRLVYVKADIVLDGGAYASSSPAVAANAATLGIGPYEVPHVAMDCYAVYTNNPPCGAMRGFGAVQACFAYEAQMDKLAAALRLDPVEIRIKNAMREGSVMPTGQVVDSAAPVAEILNLVRSRPLPSAPPQPARNRDLRTLPGGVSNTTHGEGIVRGVG